MGRRARRIPGAACCQLKPNEIILQIEIYKEQTESVVPILRDMGLRQIGEMYPDYFYTNIPAAELGH